MSDDLVLIEQPDGSAILDKPLEEEVEEEEEEKEEEPPVDPPVSDPPVLVDPVMIPKPPVPRVRPAVKHPTGHGARSVDPALQYQFSVELTHDPFGLIGFMIPIKGYFTEISGLDVEWETAEYKTTNLIGWPRSSMIHLRPVYTPITLRRGITDDEGFWLWHQLMFLDARPLLRCYVTITMYDRAYKPMAMWSVENCWPSKITGPQIRSDSSDFAIEELTLVHTGIHRMYLEPEFMAIDAIIQLMLP